jgi:hypothetical protein
MIPLYWSIQNQLQKRLEEVQRLAKQSKRLGSVLNEIQA